IVTQVVQVACRNNTVANLQNLSGLNTLAGDVLVTEGGSNVVFRSDIGRLTINGAIRYIGSLVGNRTWNFQGTGELAVSGGLPAAANGSVISLIKSGNGLLTLSGLDTRTGNTLVTAGR